MTDQERRESLFKLCEEAFTSSGSCDRCGGSGETPSAGTGSSYRSSGCAACRGSGRDPGAELRALQAIGLLLLEQVRGG